MREIHLPELLNIQIKNYTLYPEGLNFTFDFIKGFNLVIGGNGMGKTTFVSLIKYAIIGNYKKQYEYTRTYKDNKIEKRLRHPDSFFKNRIDESIKVKSDPEITITFKIKDTTFKVNRGLKTVQINSISINNVDLEGEIISEEKYESRKSSKHEIQNYLQYKYETQIEQLTGLTFDDLIFFVNYILFFGEDHKTILWDDSVQNDLFNKFFNSPELDLKRQESEREAKYYDSRARHKSEDIRAIKKVLDKIENKDNNDLFSKDNSLKSILDLKEKIEVLDKKIDEIHEKRKENDIKATILQSDINKLSLEIDGIEKSKNLLQEKLSFSKYKSLHNLYNPFLNNIKTNHICPMCNSKNEELYSKVIENPNNCWACDNEILHTPELNDESKKELEKINSEYNEKTRVLRYKQLEIKSFEKENKELDQQFRKTESNKRIYLKDLRELEYENSKETKSSELQAIYDEIEKLNNDKEEFSKISEEKKNEATKISMLIEKTIQSNVLNFSKLFSNYAKKFLGIECSLTFDILGNDSNKKFYPVIGGIIRQYEEELSESQRFFVDHSFRMSLLTHFHNSPSFYIVETPDSSLDLSYEKNAAEVFMSFLQNPYSLILTSNLNNSLFIDYIFEKSDKTKVSIIPLYEIAKKSVIQSSTQELTSLYDKIKKYSNGQAIK